MISPIVFLIDNGSLRPQATLDLRCMARLLALRIGLRVEAVSLLHAHKVPAAQLNGVSATIVKQRLRECAELGQRDFICLPLLLGPSLAISEYLPQIVEALRVDYADLKVKITPVLAGVDMDTPDPRLAQMLAEHVRQTQCWQQVRASRPAAGIKVALVDHGTPILEVNRVRNAVARQLSEALGLSIVQPCSMERRDGETYAFNEPLLENLGSRGD
jgi:hypothetical protein